MIVFTFFDLLADILRNRIALAIVGEYLLNLTPSMLYQIAPLAEQHDQDGDPQRHADHVTDYGARAAPGLGCREIIGHRFKLTTVGGKTR